MTSNGTSATAPDGFVPKAYVEKVGETASSGRPSGRGRTSSWSFNPGVELVMEAWTATAQGAQCESASFSAACPRNHARRRAQEGEVDIAYLLTGPVAEESSGRRASSSSPQGVAGHVLARPADQWDPKSPCMTSACGRRRALPSTGRRSTRPRRRLLFPRAR